MGRGHLYFQCASGICQCGSDHVKSYSEKKAEIIKNQIDEYAAKVFKLPRFVLKNEFLWKWWGWFFKLSIQSRLDGEHLSTKFLFIKGHKKVGELNVPEIELM